MSDSVKKCVIPVAGYGTRLFPATKAIPKAFFPIVDIDGIAKPIIQIIVGEAVSSGIEEICIVTQKEQLVGLKNYFEQGVIPFSKEKTDRCLTEILEMGRRIQYAIQYEAEGFGHAVYCANEFVGKEPFLLLLGDHIYISNTKIPCSKQLMDIFREYGKSVNGVAKTPEYQLKYFGAVNGKRLGERTFEVNQLKEKPDVEYARAHLAVEGLASGTYLCSFGIDVLTSEILDIIGYNIKNDIRHSGEFQLRNAMETLMEQEGLYAHEVDGQRYDIGIPEEFIRTIVNFALHGPYEQFIRNEMSSIIC